MGFILSDGHDEPAEEAQHLQLVHFPPPPVVGMAGGIAIPNLQWVGDTLRWPTGFS